MKVLLTFFLILSVYYSASSYTLKELSQLHANGYAGTKFVVTFPPNATPSDKYKELLQVNISAVEDTKVVISSPADTIIDSIFITANNNYMLDSDKNPWLWDLVCQTSRTLPSISNQSIIIESDKPIVVSMVNINRYSSHGLVYLPVESWGYEYNYLLNYAGGFQLVSHTDSSKVEVGIRTSEPVHGQMLNGYQINENVRSTLNKGEFFWTEARYPGTFFDISGTKAESGDPDKPEKFSMISYNKGGESVAITTVPTASYGKEYITESLYKNLNGDFFRFYSPSDSNKIEISWYDWEYDTLVGDVTYTMSEGEIWSPSDNAPKNYYGRMKINCSENTLVYQYPTGSFNTSVFRLSPTELWVEAFSFSIPDNPKYLYQYPLENRALLTFKGSRNDPELHDSLINSIRVNDTVMSVYFPLDSIKNIKGTDYYIVQSNPLQAGAYQIVANTLMGGAVFGSGRGRSYSYSLGGGIKSLTNIGSEPLGYHIDTDYSVNDKTGDVDILFYSNEGNHLGWPAFSEEFQSQITLQRIDLVDTDFITKPEQSTVAFRVKRKDPSLDLDLHYAMALKGVAVLGDSNYVERRISLKGISLPTESVALSSDRFELGTMIVGESKSFEVEIWTNPERPSFLKSIEFPENMNLSTSNEISLPSIAKDSFDLKFDFVATKAQYPEETSFEEKVVIESSVGYDTVYITGNVVYTSIKAEEEATVAILTLDDRCLFPYRYSLRNEGGATALIEDILLKVIGQEPVSYRTGIPGFEIIENSMLPIEIASGETSELLEICYKGKSLFREIKIEPVFNKQIDMNNEFITDVRFDLVGNVSYDMPEDVTFSTNGNGLYTIHAEQKLDIDIFSIDGRKLSNLVDERGGDYNINLSSIQNGSYLITIRQGDRLWVKKVNLYK